MWYTREAGRIVERVAQGYRMNKVLKDVMERVKLGPRKIRTTSRI